MRDVNEILTNFIRREITARSLTGFRRRARHNSPVVAGTMAKARERVAAALKSVKRTDVHNKAGDVFYFADTEYLVCARRSCAVIV